MPATELPTLPHHVMQAVVKVCMGEGRTEALHPVDMFGEVAELVRNVDLMDEYADAIETHIHNMLMLNVSDEMKRLIEEDEAERGMYDALTFSELHAECDANEYVADALAACKVDWNGDSWSMALINRSTDRVNEWLGKRHDARWLTPQDCADVLAEYARIVAENHTEQAVKLDDLGEVHFEIVETAEDMGFELTEEDHDALADLVDAWRETIPEDSRQWCATCSVWVVDDSDGTHTVGTVEDNLTPRCAVLTAKVAEHMRNRIDPARTYPVVNGTVTVPLAEDPCRCGECAEIHAEFIGVFGRWPDQTHAEGQALKARRIANEASWARATR